MPHTNRLLQACQCCIPKAAVVSIDFSKPLVTQAPEVRCAASFAESVTKPAKPWKTKLAPSMPQPESQNREAPPPKKVTVSVEALAAMLPSEVIDIMRDDDCMTDHELIGAACKQLRILCRQDDHCQACDSLGAAGLLYRAMVRHPLIPTVQQQACAALINLCAGDNFERRNHAADSGALQAVVMAMKTHMNYHGVQEMGFVAIQNICFGSDPNGQVRRARAIEAGALDAIVAAIRKYEERTSVLDQGAATLRLLTNNVRHLKAKAVEAGAKKEWLTPSAGFSARFGSLTSRMLVSLSPGS